MLRCRLKDQVTTCSRRYPSVARFRRCCAGPLLYAIACLVLACSRYDSRVIESGPIKLPARKWVTLRGPMRAASDVGELCLQLPLKAGRFATTSEGPEGFPLTQGSLDSLPVRPLRITARFYRDDGALVPTLGGGNGRPPGPGTKAPVPSCLVTPYRTHATYVRVDVWASDTVTVRKIWWESYPLTVLP